MTDYRPEIDGLRALAILPVVFFHAGFPGFSGGYVGVDVFFVISGYLITGLILRKQGGNSFSLPEFYERRIRRILPALIIMMLVTVPFAWVWLLPQEFTHYAKTLIGGALFGVNFLFWQSGDYFAPVNELKPLLHIWTLSVEEQFYVIFPLALLLLLRGGKSWLLIGLAVAAAVSFGIAEWGWRMRPVPNYYLLPSRGYELLFGAMIAVWFSEKPIRLSQAQAALVSLLGLAAIVYAIVSFDRHTPFVSNYPLIPSLGAAALIVGLQTGTPFQKIFAARPLVAIGLISYSLYLWHFPIFTFARIRMMGEPDGLIMAALVGLSFASAWGSWAMIEKPIRNRSFASRRQIFVGGALGSLLVVVIGMAGLLIPNRSSDRLDQLHQVQKQAGDQERKCIGREGQRFRANELCVYGDQANLDVAIWGDSHANALAAGLGGQLQERKRGLVEVTFNGCFPVLGIRYLARLTGCDEFNDAAFEYLINNNQIKTVILHARWAAHMEGEGFDNGRGGKDQVADLIIEGPGGERDRKALFQRQLPETVKGLLDAGKRVVLLYSIPEMGWHVPERLMRQLWLEGDESDIKIARTLIDDRIRSSDVLLDGLPAYPDLVRVRPVEILCDTTICPGSDQGIPLYFDDDHLSKIGARRLANAIAGQL